MSNQHIKEPGYWPEEYRGSGSQITQNLPKKYTILAEIKILQDRLQDMYTNRADVVNMTGDGWAAAHQNEIKEIFWVYLKALGWISGLHGAVFGTMIGVFGGILAGVLFEATLYTEAVLLFLATTLFFVGPFIYVTYAEVVTEDSAKWVVGNNTKMFHDEMTKAMQFIIVNTWLITIATFIGSLFIVGLLNDYIVRFSIGMLEVFRIVIPERLHGNIVNNGMIYGIGWFVLMIGTVYVGRTWYMNKVKGKSEGRSIENRKTQNSMKFKDNVQEVREMFK